VGMKKVGERLVLGWEKGFCLPPLEFVGFNRRVGEKEGKGPKKGNAQVERKKKGMS